MKQLLLSQFPWPVLPTIALLIFFGFFLGLIFRLSMKSQKVILAQAERLPLSDGDKHE